MAVPKVPEGYSVKFTHRRFHRSAHPGKFDDHPVLSEKGGWTTARLIGPDGLVVLAETAYCHPSDNYNKRIGRAVSLGRALRRAREDGLIPC
jgi:hypothetical protein